MNPRRSFTRKIGYLVVISLLLIPLYMLGHPVTPASKGRAKAPGGTLAQLRETAKLSETRLGEIDATGETIKLATLGMRGVATVFLWQKANDYKMRKDWTNLSATLTQLTKLEPHFTAVWRHQGWNLAYNVSAEFDGYRDRYRWVIRGIEFLQSGIPYNREEPRLPYDVGGFISEKLGRADEFKQFRRLFKEDDDFNGPRAKDQRDNWLVGKEWFEKAQDLTQQGAILRGINPVVFYSKAPMCQMNYAETLESEGIFQERALYAWQKAAKEWSDFGDRDLATSQNKEAIHLNDLERFTKEALAATVELETLAPQLRESLLERKRSLLSEEERAALATPADQRTAEQSDLAMKAEGKLVVSNAEFARSVGDDKKPEAKALVERIDRANAVIGALRGANETVNYIYWQRKAQYEQDAATRAAREYMYNGDQAFALADLIAARGAYELGWAEWRKLFDNPQFQDVRNDTLLGEELVGFYKKYRTILEKCDERFPEKFVLADVLEPYLKADAQKNGDGQSPPAAAEEKK